MLPGIIYFVFALVAAVSAFRAGSAGGGTQRLGMSAAGIGFILLGVEYYIGPANVPNRTLLTTAGVFLVAGVVLYWWGHLKS